MRILALFFSLLPILSMGQGFGFSDHVYLSPVPRVTVSGTGLLPPGMLFWYVANDLTNTPVSVWTDRIQGYNWYQTNASAKPTWATNVGVTFDGIQQFLYASNGVIPKAAGDGAFMLVCKFADTGGSQMVLCDTFSGGAIIVGKNTADKLYSFSAGTIGPMGTTTFDLISAVTNVSSQFEVLTNGVPGWFGSGAWNRASLTHVGSGDGNGFGKVTINEFIVWTNTMVFDPATISNMHYYATNTYPHSP